MGLLPHPVRKRNDMAIRRMPSFNVVFDLPVFFSIKLLLLFTLTGDI